MHVPEDKLDDYRALRRAMETLDHYLDIRLGQRRPIAPQLRKSLAFLREQMLDMRKKEDAA